MNIEIYSKNLIQNELLRVNKVLQFSEVDSLYTHAFLACFKLLFDL